MFFYFSPSSMPSIIFFIITLCSLWTIMKANVSVIQYMGMIMRLDTLNIDYVLSMVEIVNNSYVSAKDVVTILQQIFKNEKSAKILLATQVLEYLVKNCNRNFHQAANKESFQKSVLGLLKRQRGKMNLLKQLRSNTQNWSRIESRILYLIQLWYDAFILEQSKYPNIINNYKILRKENIVFPPRNVNQRSLLAVQTQSPIFDNIQSIAQADKQKFKKRLKAMGLTHLSEKFQQKQKMMKNAPIKKEVFSSKQINIDDISEKIAIIQSQDYEPKKVLRIVEEVKVAIEHAKVKPNQQKYWKQVKEAAEIMIAQWQQKNAQLIRNEQQRYLQLKMSGQVQKSQSQSENSPIKSPIAQKKYSQKSQQKVEQVWDLLGDAPEQKKQKKNDAFDEWTDFTGNSNQNQAKKNHQQTNLLDL